MTRKSRVPRPEKSSAVVAGMPVRAGTSTVAPNMAITCCTPMPTVRGQLSRSSGATTVPGVGVPMCLISAENVLKRVRGDRSSGPLDA